MGIFVKSHDSDVQSQTHTDTPTHAYTHPHTCSVPANLKASKRRPFKIIMIQRILCRYLLIFFTQHNLLKSLIHFHKFLNQDGNQIVGVTWINLVPNSSRSPAATSPAPSPRCWTSVLPPWSTRDPNRKLVYAGQLTSLEFSCTRLSLLDWCLFFGSMVRRSCSRNYVEVNSN